MSQEETAARRSQERERSSASRALETPAVTTARRRQDQSLTAARRASGLEETIEMRSRREADLVTDIEDSLANLSTEPPINVLEAFESDARIARMLFWENTGVYRFDSLESNATEEEKLSAANVFPLRFEKHCVKVVLDLDVNGVVVAHHTDKRFVVQERGKCFASKHCSCREVEHWFLRLMIRNQAGHHGHWGLTVWC
jgi:hypothetical protein